MKKITRSNGSAIFFNPTNKPIMMMFDGTEYEAEPFERFEVDDWRMAKHFEKNYKEYGIVNITFTEGAQKLFKNEKEFFNAKCMDGLKALKARAELTLAREKQAVNESAMKNGSTIDNMFFSVKKFEDDVKEAGDALAELTKKINDQKAQPSSDSKKYESRSNQDSSKV